MEYKYLVGDISGKNYYKNTPFDLVIVNHPLDFKSLSQSIRHLKEYNKRFHFVSFMKTLEEFKRVKEILNQNNIEINKQCVNSHYIKFLNNFFHDPNNGFINLNGGKDIEKHCSWCKLHFFIFAEFRRPPKYSRDYSYTSLSRKTKINQRKTGFSS